MEKIDNTHIFQSDSDIVNEVYTHNPNYQIEYDETQEKSYCAIYFSSNDIYYPNTAENFSTNIVLQNRYEWYKTRIQYAYKHIFLRDIKKQWYITGINDKICTPNLLLNFLKEETKGFKTILIGSSAGGFAAVLYGSLLNAEKVFSFDGQFEIGSLLQTSTAQTDPLIFRLSDDEIYNKYFDVIKYLQKDTLIYYFHSMNSLWDKRQYNHIKGTKVKVIKFRTKHHGIPFLKAALPKVLNLNKTALHILTLEVHSPLLFTIQIIGIQKTIAGFIYQLISLIKKHK